MFDKLKRHFLRLQDACEPYEYDRYFLVAISTNKDYKVYFKSRGREEIYTYTQKDLDYQGWQGIEEMLLEWASAYGYKKSDIHRWEYPVKAYDKIKETLEDEVRKNLTKENAYGRVRG